MKRILILACMACVCATSLQGAILEQITSYFAGYDQPHPPSLRVLIQHDQPSVQIRVIGKHRLYDPNQKEYITTRFLGKDNTFIPTREGLKWGEEFPGLYQIQIVPTESHSRVYVNGVPYQGSITIYDIGGSLSVVNTLKIEDYVGLFVAANYSPSLPVEALEAFAIAARTYAYYLVENPQNPFWSIESSNARYKGIQTSSRLDPLLTSVLKETQDIIMVRPIVAGDKPRPFPARWEVESLSAVEEALPSKIAFSDAIKLGREGKSAPDILKKAFPEANIRIVTFTGT